MTIQTATTRSELGRLNTWTDVTVDVVLPGGADRPSRAVRVAAKQVLYRFGDGKTTTAAIVMLADPATNRTSVVSGGQSFYVSTGAGLLACFVSPGGMASSASYFSVPTAAGGYAAALERFVAEVNDERLAEANSKRPSFVGLVPAAPLGFFNANSDRLSSQSGMPTVLGYRVTDGVLQLDLRSHGGKYAGSFWIDLESQIALRSVIDGREVTEPFAGTATPLR